MFRQYWNRGAVLGGSLALLAIGATPALAASPCPAGTTAYFSVPTINLGPKDGTTVWSSDVTFFTYCGTTATDTSHPLAGVTVTDVSLFSGISDLQASANGADPGVPVGGIFPGVKLPIATPGFPHGIVTDGSGQATFLLQVQSASEPVLSNPDGSARMVALHFDYGTGLGSNPTDPFMTGGGVTASTPELDSLALFGAGAAGLAGYAMMRMRARGRRPD